MWLIIYFFLGLLFLLLRYENISKSICSALIWTSLWFIIAGVAVLLFNDVYKMTRDELYKVQWSVCVGVTLLAGIMAHFSLL